MPQTGWLKEYVYCLIVMEVRSPRSRCWQGWLLPRAVRETAPCRPLASGGLLASWHSLAWGKHHPHPCFHPHPCGAPLECGHCEKGGCGRGLPAYAGHTDSQLRPRLLMPASVLSLTPGAVLDPTSSSLYSVTLSPNLADQANVSSPVGLNPSSATA